MKVKLVKMGMDIDETRNHRVRGIVKTKDNEYLFIEILQGHRPNIRYTNLIQKEYEKEYPFEEYIWIDGCFRVDVPEDYFKNYTPKYAEFRDKSFRNIKHSKEGIIQVLQMLNPEIDDIELVDKNYIDDFCNENGFYRLYDNRLPHYTEPIKLLTYFERNNIARVKLLYTCYSTNGEHKFEEYQTIETKINDDFKEKYGIDTTNILIEEYKENVKDFNLKGVRYEKIKDINKM